MDKEIKYLHSDSWVLLAIIIAGMQKGASLKSIIAAGDFINHSIFCFEEIDGALARLSAGNYIVSRGKLFFPSDKTIEYYKNNSKPRSYIYKDWEGIKKFINASSWDHNIDPKKANEGYSFNGISPKSFDQAVASYLKSPRK
jgi:hypothetical protein